MPESRLEKTRATLPEGYQFGDSGTDDPHAGAFARLLLAVTGFVLMVVSVLWFPYSDSGSLLH